MLNQWLLELQRLELINTYLLTTQVSYLLNHDRIHLKLCMQQIKKLFSCYGMLNFCTLHSYWYWQTIDI